MKTSQEPDLNVKPQPPGAVKADPNQQLRTGLSDILGFAELLEGRADNKDLESVRQILRAGQQLLDLVGGQLPIGGDRLVGAQAPQNIETTERRDVLYVEDNDSNFTLVSRIFERRPNIRLFRAERGETGVALARTQRPHLILLDLNLPDIPGSEVLRRLREQPETKSVPVVVISADATPSQIERLLAAGARNYLTKPFSLKLLLAVVDEILETNVGSST
jgi:CheY-like chemotaxis protein